MKTINVVIGIATTIIVGSLIVLGIRAFHPEPISPYENPSVSKLPPYVQMDCSKGDADCVAKRDQYVKDQQAEQEVMNQKYQEYTKAMKDYNRDVFLIANIVGILIFVGGFLIVFRTRIGSHGAPIGMMLAGLWGIFYGYMRGWNSTNDQLKFFIGLVIAVLVIGGSMWLLERYRKSHEHPHN